MKNEQQLQYPVECHMSVIVESGREGTERALQDALVAFKVTAPLSKGATVSSGRYHAWRVTVKVNSSEELHAVDKILRAVKGVRMVV